MNWKLLSALSIGALLFGIDMMIVTLALPAIGREFAAPLADLKLILTAYFVSAGSLTLVMCRLGDRFGLKAIYLLGLIVFAVFTFLCGISSTLNELILYRVCQGFGLACTFPILFTITSRVHGKEYQSKAFGFLKIFTAISFGLGPILSGIILTWLNWRWIFFFNIPLAVLGLIAGIVWIDLTQDENEKDTASYLSMLLLIFGLGLIGFACNRMVYWKLYSFEFIGMVVMGLLLILFMGVREYRAKHPLIRIDYLLERKYLLSMVVREASQFALFGALFSLPLFFENILEFTPLRSGLLILFLTLSMGLVSFFGGNIMNRASLSGSLFFIVLLGLLGSTLLLLYRFAPFLIFVYMGMVVIAISTNTSPFMFMLASLRQFPKCSRGLVFGIAYTFTILGGSLGTTFTSYVLSQASENRLNTLLEQNAIHLSSENFNELHRISSGTTSLSEIKGFGPMSSKLKPIALNSYYHAYAWVYWMYIGFFVISLICAIYYRKWNKEEIESKPN